MYTSIPQHNNILKTENQFSMINSNFKVKTKTIIVNGGKKEAAFSRAYKIYYLLPLLLIIVTMGMLLKYNYFLLTDRSEVQLLVQRSHKHEETDRATVCSQRTRLDYINEMCADFTPQANATHRQFIIDDVNQVAFCYTPKIACTTWKAIMANISSKGRVRANMSPYELRKLHYEIGHGKYGLRWQGGYTSDLDAYTKFLIVRNPMDRLTSAFYDKMQGKDTSFIQYAHIIAKMFKRYDLENESEFPSFVQFVKAILDRKRFVSSFGNNEHWDNYFLNCNPCDIKYDYVLKLETMDSDMEMFITNVYGESALKYLGNVNMNSVHGNKSKGFIPKSTLLEFKSLPEELLERIVTRYRNEFEFYGYRFNNVNYTTDCLYKKEKSSHIELNCC